jgi:hypothetical protein
VDFRKFVLPTVEDAAFVDADVRKTSVRIHSKTI